MSDTKQRVSGLWLNESKAGHKYQKSATITKADLAEALEQITTDSLNFLIFKNSYKDADHKPDYILYVTEGGRGNQPHAPEEEGPDDSDIPF